MATNFKRMDEIRSIIKKYTEIKSFKGTARRMKVSRNTVKAYIHRCQNRGIPLREVESMNDDQLYKVFYTDETSKENARQKIFDGEVASWLIELRKRGVTRYLLWQEYRQDNPDGFCYSQFCDRLKRQIKRKDLTLAMNHPAGEKLMLDFAGGKIAWHDPESGEQFWAEVLIGVLPHSHYTFAIALENQKTETFIHGLNKALEYIGGVPQYLLSDNLKAYVTRADRYEPDYNELSVQLSEHYGIHLQSTRVARPKDKGSVENMVSTAYTRLYAPLRNRVFHSIGDINEAFAAQLLEHNNIPFQQKEGSRQSVFETYEKGMLNLLPADAFELKKTTRAKIQNNYHAFLGEEKNYYSVPHKYVRQKVEIVYTTEVVEIYLKGKRIAIHKRLGKKEKYQFVTQQGHRPKSHQIFEQIRQYNDTQFMELAAKVGENTHWAIDHILIYQPNKDQAYKSCLGILRLGKSYGHDRLEKACKKCKQMGQVNYKILKNILGKNLEEHPIKGSVPPKITHDNIRGSNTYF